jgi:hypothetical protein
MVTQSSKLAEDPKRAHERRLIDDANRANDRIAKLDPSWRMSKIARDDPNVDFPNVASEEPRRAKDRTESVDETSISFAFKSSPSRNTHPYADSAPPIRRKDRIASDDDKWTQSKTVSWEPNRVTP